MIHAVLFAAPHVTAANNDRNLNAHIDDIDDTLREEFRLTGVDAETAFAG
jgi:hypothetical protein